jgi:hypothetical protein
LLRDLCLNQHHAETTFTSSEGWVPHSSPVLA